jgi:hypothetical protein
MEENYDYLIEILESSVTKNGEKPLTNKWLLNILKMVRERIDKDEDFTYDPNWD